MNLTKEQVIALLDNYCLIDHLSLRYDEFEFDPDDENLLILIPKNDPEELPWTVKIDTASIDTHKKTITFEYAGLYSCGDGRVIFDIVSIPSSDDLCKALDIREHLVCSKQLLEKLIDNPEETS